MQTIIDLVNEIRWSPEEDPNQYRLGYYDRVAGEIRWIRFLDIDFQSSDKFAVYVRGEEGLPEKHIPYHRFRRVMRGDEIVWAREKDE